MLPEQFLPVLGMGLGLAMGFGGLESLANRRQAVAQLPGLFKLSGKRQTGVVIDALIDCRLQQKGRG